MHKLQYRTCGDSDAGRLRSLTVGNESSWYVGAWAETTRLPRVVVESDMVVDVVGIVELALCRWRSCLSEEGR